ncbi:hypothetical protein MSPP1_001504 [Malassezia sp. CBS 17886]|nr:hypothetical protein MSPP1_001504 [Malassezia sp. CBS 17886]
MRGSSVMHVGKPSSARGFLTRARPKAGNRVFSATFATLTVLSGLCFGVYCMDSRAGVYRWVFGPAMQVLMDPEMASKFAIKLLEHGIAPRDFGTDDAVLHTELFGRKLTNPIGIAAGFDKQGEAVDGLFDLGFGFVEIGSVTPQPQPGNPPPRMFRLPLDAAMVNRMGFNSDGQAVVRERLDKRLREWVVRVLSAGRALVSDVGVEQPDDPTHLSTDRLFATYPVAEPALLDRTGVPRSLKEDRLLSVNLGKNKTSAPDSAADYVEGVKTLGPFADMLVINISSPNTPGLRRMQRRGVIEDLLRDVVRARNVLVAARPDGACLPLLVKVSPDLTDTELRDISDAALNTSVDGIVVSNTTVTRPPGLLSAQYVHEQGGLSGPPLKPLALHALSVLHARSGGKVPLIGCGGISSGADALEFARHGASAVQLYTALGYQGPGLPRFIKDEVTAELKRQGTTWEKIVGTAVPDLGPAVYEPDPVQRIGIFPGSQDAFDHSVASVRTELENLRHSFGRAPRHDTEQRRTLPFTVHPEDHRYIDLLDRAHRALDEQPHFSDDASRPGIPVPQRASSVPEHLLMHAADEGITQGEALHNAVHAAAHEGHAAQGGRQLDTAAGLRAKKDDVLARKLDAPETALRAADAKRVI